MSKIPQYQFAKKMDSRNLIDILPAVVENIPKTFFEVQRWFGSKSKNITGIALLDAAVFSNDRSWYALALIQITFADNQAELYAVPLAFIDAESFAESAAAGNRLLTPVLEVKTADGVYDVVDALSDDEFCRLQLDYIKDSLTVETMKGSFNFRNTAAFFGIAGQKSDTTQITVKRLEAEQSNSSTVYGNAFIMKNFRKLSYGINPDLEVPLFLTTRTAFRNIASVAGYIEYNGKGNMQISIASLQNFVPDAEDSWSYTLAHLGSLFKFALKQSCAPCSNQSNVYENIESKIREFSGRYLDSIYGLGQVTGKLHVALASETGEQNFAPEETTMADVIQWISRIQYYGKEVLSSLRNNIKLFPSTIAKQGQKIAENIPFYISKASELTVLSEERVWKTRLHNDFHLGQVLRTGDDFIIIDFEGEPARSLEERRQKQSPLKDVAGMLRSFNYAVYAAIFGLQCQAGQARILEMWGKSWEESVKKSYLDGYLAAADLSTARFLPDSIETMLTVLSIFQMDKAIYELNYELNNRPDWIEIPLKYLDSLLDQKNMHS